jgi:hypothetical protein
MPTSVRLDTQIEALVSRLAKQRGQTKSEVIREALMTLVREKGALGHPKTPYEAMVPFLGCASGGPPDLSERTGRKFGEHLRKRKRL